MIDVFTAPIEVFLAALSETIDATGSSPRVTALLLTYGVLAFVAYHDVKRVSR